MRVVRWSSRNSCSSASGSCGAAFHLVQHLQLPLQQGLVAPGQAAEDVADSLTQLRLPDRRLHRGPLHRGERVGGLGDLPGPGAERQRRRLGVHVHVVALAQPADHGGQALIGQGAHRLPEARQLAGDAVTEPEQQQGGDDDRGEPGPADEEQPEQDDVAFMAGALGHRLRGRVVSAWVNAATADPRPDCQAAGLTGIRAPGLVATIRSSIALKLV